MCPSHTSKILKQLLDLPATQLWTHSETVVRHFRDTLDPLVPSYVQGRSQRGLQQSHIFNLGNCMEHNMLGSKKFMTFFV